MHSAPDRTGELRLDALDTGRAAHEAEMAGFVLKSHHYPTAPVAHALSRVYPGLSVFGSITLNHEVGGLNPDAVQAAADMDAKVVWMPTFSAYERPGGRSAGPGLSPTDERGRLLPQVNDILDVVLRHEMVLASGHLNPSDTLALFRAARDQGISRLIATHPAGGASAAEMREMAALGAYVEHTFLACTPSRGRTTPQEMASDIRALGVEHCVVTTDFGQWMNPSPAEGMRMAIAELLNAGMSEDEVSTLAKTNPRRLMGLV